jgi:ribonuclease-3
MVDHQRIDMTVDDAERVARLAERLGARLADRRTALAALTHKSYVNEHRGEGGEDNERLEFLGDAVIDLVVSEYLMSRFPQAREGDLSKLRAAVVDESGLAAMGRALGLGDLLRLGRGEEMTGGREKVSLLADSMEAVIAAVFLDGGLAAAHALVARFLDEAYAQAETGTLDRDFKTQLQELGQARHRTSPRYRVVAEVGPDHSKTFEIEVELRGEVLGRGSGRSKKDAEQAAARGALELLAARGSEETSPPPGAPAPAAEATVPPKAELEPAPEPVPRQGKSAGAKAPAPARKAKAKPRKRAAAARPPARTKSGKGATPRKAGARRSRKIADPRGRD